MDPKFKLGRHTLLLLVFQVATGILIGIIFYIFSDLLKIIPASLDRPCGILSLLIGSMYFGQRMEKKNPGALNKERIKKLSFVSTLINFVLSSLFLFFMLFLDSSKNDSKGFDKILIITMGILVLTTLITYAATSFAIKLGIKTSKPQKPKLVQA